MQQARPCTRCTSFAAAQEWCRWCSRGAERVANVPKCTKSVPSGTLRGCVRTRQQMVGCRSKAAHAFLVMSSTLALRGCTNGRGAAAGELSWRGGRKSVPKVYPECTPSYARVHSVFPSQAATKWPDRAETVHTHSPSCAPHMVWRAIQTHAVQPRGNSNSAKMGTKKCTVKNESVP